MVFILVIGRFSLIGFHPGKCVSMSHVIGVHRKDRNGRETKRTRCFGNFDKLADLGKDLEKTG